MLLLASQSTYKYRQLAVLGLPIKAVSPQTEEIILPSERPDMAARRLAEAKAESLRDDTEGLWVIGSDQTAHVERETHVLRKPGSPDAAIDQLLYCSGKTVLFHSGIAVRPPGSQTCLSAVETVRVYFRQLDRDEVIRYVKREEPLDCVGAFKCEGLGISLFEAIESRDPTALVGIPMIALCRLLRTSGLTLP